MPKPELNQSFGWRDAAAVACLFLSGFAGLVYEVSWIRRAALVFGSTSYSLSTVLAVFFLGLALGSYGFGRIAPRLARPMRAFALLEVGVGALALSSPFAFVLADAWLGIAYRGLDESGIAILAVRVALVSLVLLPPTILMGGTLPLFSQQYVVRDSRIGTSVGLLYGLNTLGAVAGCLAAGLWLIPELGVRGAIGIGAGVSLSAALTAALLGLRAPSRDSPPEPAIETATDGQTRAERTRRLWVGTVVCLVGFVALGNEVLWVRHLSLLIGNTVHTFTATLAVVLLGIVLGSAGVSYWVDRIRARAFTLGLLQVLSGLMVLLLMLIPRETWNAVGSNFLISAVLLLPPAILSGASFPLAVRIWVDRAETAATGVGKLAALSTVGGIAGSLGVGFVLLPALGIHTSLLLLTGLAIAVGSLAWLTLDRVTPAWTRGGLTFAGVAAWVMIPTAMGTQLPADFLRAGGKLLDYREGLASNVSVTTSGQQRQLRIDGIWQGATGKGHQALTAHVPMLLHPDPKRVLVVGAGAGQTPSRFLMYDIDALDCVDIEPAVFEMIRDYFSADWMNDERVSLIHADGRNHIAHSRESYDVVSVEVGQIYRPGVPFFYTDEFYRDVHDHLSPGGVISQFVPVLFFDVDQFRGVLRTFLEVFPHSILWYNTSELLLLGVKEGSPTFTPERLALLESRGPIRDDLTQAYWGGPAEHLNDWRVFLASLLVGPRNLAELSEGGEIYRDDRPVLDYATASGAPGGNQLLLPILSLIRRHLSPARNWMVDGIPSQPDDWVRVQDIRAKNIDDIVSSIMLSRVLRLKRDRPTKPLIASLTRATQWNADNFALNLQLGQLLLSEGQPRKAHPYFARAATLRPFDGRARRGLAQVLQADPKPPTEDTPGVR